VGESANEVLLLIGRHGRIAAEHRFATTVREAGGSVLQRHRARQADTLLGAHVGRHAQATDRGAAGDVVDDEHRLEPERLLVHVNDLRGT
jgi:hypothetical protein